ncbi:Uncharacterized protein PCOAH_00006110 [Plasmodium coatneyi]|uniref:SET domain-containing protein n=1 Tax=Plasmodium coatneyi TaxID=208452 RepID=A0A1B1DU01_9APIC|nr:Uncharacterized protein PCOAH_00006110 [Plasmodium coatneyi]ANQ06276.1 Uncharacterized protein PCOAH_00006110 [Plasmodium coatneyi]
MQTSTSNSFADANANTNTNTNENCSGNKCNASENTFTNAATVIWIEKEKLDSIIHIPVYSDLSKYVSDLSRHPVKQNKKEDEEGGGMLSRIFLLFDDKSCNIAVDISAIYKSEDNKIPLLIYERYYFWSLHFLFEKSKIKRQKLSICSDINGRYGISSLNKCDDDVYMYTSIYNSAYNRNDDEKNDGVSSFPELGKDTYKDVNKELTIYDKDYIKYLYLNDLKNIAMMENKSNGENDVAFSTTSFDAFKGRIARGHPLFEKGLYPKNEIKWYRLKIKIERAEKKKKTENRNLIKGKGFPISSHHFSFNSHTTSGNRNGGIHHNRNRVFSYDQRTLNNPNSFKKETCDPTFNANLLQNISHFSLIDNDATREKINHLIKIQKRSFFTFNQEKDKNLLDISNDELLLLSPNERSESVFDVHKRESLSICGNQTGKRRKRSNWFYYRSSSNETNRALDDDGRSTSRGNSFCALHRGTSHVENKRKKEEVPLGCELRGDDKNADDKGNGPCGSLISCDLACTLSRYRNGNWKEVRSPKGRQPPDGHADDTFTNSRLPSENRTYVRTVNVGESSTEFHSFDIEEDVDVMTNVPVVVIDPPEKKPERVEREIKTNVLFMQEKKNPVIITHNTKVYQENVDKYNSELERIISEPFDQKEGREKIKKGRDHNIDTQTTYLNKILKSILNKEKSHLNCLSKNFKRIEGFYKRNYKIYIIEKKDYLYDRKNCFKSDVNAYNLSAPTSDDTSKEVNILDEFKMYLRRCKGEYRPRMYQTHIATGASKQIGGGKNGVDFQTNVIYTEKVEHSNGYDPGDNHAGEREQNNITMKNTLTKIIPKGEGEAEQTEGTSISSSNRDAIKTDPTKNNPPEEGIIFYAHNRKNPSCVKALKEGDTLYIKFNNSSDDYDKIRVLKKDDLFQVLICLMKNKECLKLSNISTYSPDLLWNLSMHFRNNTYDMEMNLEKIYAHFCRRYEMTSQDDERPTLDLQLEFAPVMEGVGDRKFDTHLPQQRGCSPEWSSDSLSEGSSETISDSSANATKGGRKFKRIRRVKRENLKEIEIMKLKDYVSFLDKFLQNVNDAKLKRLKNIQTEYYKKYEFDRTINKLNKQQLIDLFVDRKNEVNTIPLSFLKEKSRNIIYEENIKMNMFACIKIIFDDVKGRCIYAASDLNKFDFVFEYVGELLTHNEAMERERKYNKNKKKGCYMFYFKHENKRYCIDGTEENIDAAINSEDKKYFLRSFARLVNHSKKNSNLIPKVLTVASLPRLFFVAARNIKEGEELLIDYGERDREIIKNNEWLKC